jgi:DnaK suppressor protein
MERETARQLLEAERRAADRLAGAERSRLARSHDDAFDELSTTDQHQADMASETYDREETLTILLMAQEHLADIDHALDKVANGTYGRCETCSTLMSDERLEARPAARFCAAHERDWELGRFLAPVAAERSTSQDAHEPGWAELAALPEDDDGDDDLMSPEEAAMHVEVTTAELDA